MPVSSRVAPVLLAAALLAIAPAAFAQGKVNPSVAAAPGGAYKLDPRHTSVTLKLSHMGLSHYTMRFDGASGSYSFDPAHPGASHLQVAIDARSIDTGDPKFNQEIASDFLEAGKYPQITFVSTSVTPGDGVRGQVAGDLTLHGVTRPVVLDVVYNGSGKGMTGEARMGFSATTVIHRSDFGVKKYVPLVGDDVMVLIETEATH